MKTIKFRRPFLNKDGSFSHFSYWGVNIGDTVFTTPGQCNWADPKEDQQFTDLNDCKGTEIYEGDIVELSYSTVKREIIFNNGAFHAKTTHLLRLLYSLEPDEIEIIGNIYENPDLI